MYMVRDGPLFAHAAQFPRGRLPRPFCYCCGVVGIVLTVGGGIALGLGQKKYKRDKDYSIVLVGSVTLGFGFIFIILTLFLTLSWSTIAVPHYNNTENGDCRSSSAHVPVHRMDPIADDIEEIVEMESIRNSLKSQRIRKFSQSITASSPHGLHRSSSLDSLPCSRSSSMTQHQTRKPLTGRNSSPGDYKYSSSKFLLEKNSKTDFCSDRALKGQGTTRSQSAKYHHRSQNTADVSAATRSHTINYGHLRNTPKSSATTTRSRQHQDKGSTTRSLSIPHGPRNNTGSESSVLRCHSERHARSGKNSSYSIRKVQSGMGNISIDNTLQEDDNTGSRDGSGNTS